MRWQCAVRICTRGHNLFPENASSMFDQLVAIRGKLAMAVSDNGREPTSNAVLKWAAETGVRLCNP